MKTPAFRIFHTWWGFVVPQYATLSKYDTDVIGLYLPPDKKQADGHLRSDTYSAMTIAQAAAMRKNGTTIKLNDPKEGVLIYELVMDHLANWFEYLRKDGLIERFVPIEDLRTLADFAESVFPLAHRYGYYPKKLDNGDDTLLTALESMYDTGKEKNKGGIKYNHKLIESIEALHRKRVANTR